MGRYCVASGIVLGGLVMGRQWVGNAFMGQTTMACDRAADSFSSLSTIAPTLRYVSTTICKSQTHPTHAHTPRPISSPDDHFNFLLQHRRLSCLSVSLMLHAPDLVGIGLGRGNTRPCVTCKGPPTPPNPPDPCPHTPSHFGTQLPGSTHAGVPVSMLLS